MKREDDRIYERVMRYVKHYYWDCRKKKIEILVGSSLLLLHILKDVVS